MVTKSYYIGLDGHRNMGKSLQLPYPILTQYGLSSCKRTARPDTLGGRLWKVGQYLELSREAKKV